VSLFAKSVRVRRQFIVMKLVALKVEAKLELSFIKPVAYIDIYVRPN